MAKLIRRSITSHTVTVTDAVTGNEIEVYTEGRKVDETKALIKATKKHEKAVLISVETKTEVREITLEAFLEHSTVVGNDEESEDVE